MLAPHVRPIVIAQRIRRVRFATAKVDSYVTPLKGENPTFERIQQSSKRKETKVQPGSEHAAPANPPKSITGEIGGPTGPEPTRYGDWEKNGRVSDF